MLLLRAGVDVKARCFSGWTALMRACNGGHYEIAKVLIEAGADINIKNNDGYTAYDRIPANNQKLLKLLKEHGGAS
jgi:ankyrin repeat protein